MMYEDNYFIARECSKKKPHCIEYVSMYVFSCENRIYLASQLLWSCCMNK